MNESEEGEEALRIQRMRLRTCRFLLCRRFRTLSYYVPVSYFLKLKSKRIYMFYQQILSYVHCAFTQHLRTILAEEEESGLKSANKRKRPNYLPGLLFRPKYLQKFEDSMSVNLHGN